jgi:hypothetical protein
MQCHMEDSFYCFTVTSNSQIETSGVGAEYFTGGTWGGGWGGGGGEPVATKNLRLVFKIT